MSRGGSEVGDGEEGDGERRMKRGEGLEKGRDKNVLGPKITIPVQTPQILIPTQLKAPETFPSHQAFPTFHTF